MATIRKRGEYSWEAQIRRKGHPPLTKTFIYHHDAEAWARMTESEIERGVFISRTAAENTTLKQALERYELEIATKKEGAKNESYILKRFIASKLANRSVASIRSGDIATWRDERLKEVSPATVKRELVVLSHLFSIARREWGMESLLNPVQGTSKPKQPNGRDRRVSQEEIDTICQESESLELPAIVRLAVETGMRRGEIVGLQWPDIDLNARTVHLRKTKNGEERDVPLSTAAVATLQAILDAAKKKKGDEKKVIPLRKSGHVFGSRPNTVTQAFIRTVARARAQHELKQKAKRTSRKPMKTDNFLFDLTFHDLRHEATSRFFEKGLHAMEAASITGHKDLRMLKRYTHLRAEDLAKKLG